MENLYWITRLDYFSNFCFAFCVIIGFALIPLGSHYLSILKDSYEEELKKNKPLRNVIICLFTFWIICLSGTIFIPSTKEYLAIYGGGKIIEYIENNPKVKDVPDKVINVTDLYLQKLEKELSEQEIRNENINLTEEK